MSISGYLENLGVVGNHDLTPFLRIGQVDKVYFIDDEANRSKTHPEYDVWVFDNEGGQILKENVRSMNLIGGLNDYEETILEPSESASEGELADFNTPDKRNGTFVLIAFLNGNENTPLIVGALDHPGLGDSSATSDKGIHSERIYRGVKHYINKDGEYEVTFTGVKNPDGTPVNEDQTPITFKMGLDGTVTSDGGHKLIYSSNSEGDRFLIQTNGGQIFQIEDTEGSEAISLIQKSGSLLTMANDGSVQAIGQDGAYLFLNADANEVSMVQKDGNLFSMTPDNITISHSNGTDILSIADGIIQFTSGGSVSIQPSAFGVSAGSIEMKDQVQAGLKVENGQVALGGPAAELLDLFDQMLQQMDTLITQMTTETHVGNLGFPTAPPVNASAYAAVQVQLAVIKGLLSSIKGSL